MPLKAFESLPDTARLWIYGFKESLGSEDQELVDERLASFMRSWHSHNVDVSGQYVILENRFVVMSGASRDGLSGCSIDSSVENFKFFRDQHGLDALDRGLVHFRNNDGEIVALDRRAFRSEVDAGRCGADTRVFDLTIQTLGDLRSGRFEVPLSEAWHAKAFLPA